MPDTVFAELAAFASDPNTGAVLARLERYLAARGYRGFAIGILPQPPDFEPTGFMYANWPDSFTNTYFEQKLGPEDPTVRYAMTHSRPITIRAFWDGRAGVPVSPKGRALLQLAADHGRGEGAIIPIFGPQGYRAIAAFMRKSGEPTAADLTELRLLAISVHDRLAELFRPSHDIGGHAAPPLSDRECAILALAKGGMADAAIATALGISVRTVRFHFSNAKQKLGATSRASALLTAVNLHLV